MPLDIKELIFKTVMFEFYNLSATRELKRRHPSNMLNVMDFDKERIRQSDIFWLGRGSIIRRETLYRVETF